MRLEQPVDRRFGYKVLAFIGKSNSQFACAELGLLQRHLDDGGRLLTIDHYVKVKSTVPAIAGQAAQIYVRERVLAGAALLLALAGLPFFILALADPRTSLGYLCVYSRSDPAVPNVPLLRATNPLGAIMLNSGLMPLFGKAAEACHVAQPSLSGGIRALEVDESGMAAARKIMPWGYLTPIGPGPIFTGVEKPMKVYSFDNVLIASAKVPEDFIYKVLVTLEQNKPDLIAVQPVLREYGAETAYKQYGVPYHPGALKYFKEKNLSAKAIE